MEHKSEVGDMAVRTFNALRADKWAKLIWLLQQGFTSSGSIDKAGHAKKEYPHLHSFWITLFVIVRCAY